jgi:hypothetical protein
MGEICSKNKAPEQIVNEEPVKIIKEYKSKLDKYNIEFESNYNYFKYFQLYEYIILVSNISTGKPQGSIEAVATDNTKASKNYKDEIGIGEYLSFIKNKIISNFLIYDFNNKNPENIELFEEFMQQMFDSLLAAKFTLLKDKNKNPEIKIRKKEITTVKKLYIICFGLLYCRSSFKTKIDIFFNLFMNDKSCIELSEELDDFLFFLFYIPSYLTHRTIRNLSAKYPNLLTAMNDEDDVNISEFFELQDIQRIKNIFIKELFGQNKSVTKIAFEQSFFGDKIDWIFDVSGIRYQLEMNNDQPIQQQENN